MKRIYLYPKVFPCENPYIIYLENALSIQFKIVNNKSNSRGVLDLFRFIFRVDIYYFNWIENLPSRRFGKVQILAFVCFVFLTKILRKRIVWTLHNKYSHDKTNNKWVDLMYNMMFKYSDFILTHSQSGVEFAAEKYPLYSWKVKYYIHPVKRYFPVQSNAEVKYDFIIWGTIWFYKGIIEFLKYLKESGNNRYRILIVGKCIDDQVKIELDKYLSVNTIHFNDFYEIEQIAEFAKQAKFTLFTYKAESVLSSGSLMDSIGMGSSIIGPNAGSFKDLNNYSFISTYNSFDEIPLILEGRQIQCNSDYLEIENFCEKYNWDNFGKQINNDLIMSLKLKYCIIFVRNTD